MVENFILIIPGNRYDSLGRPTKELTEDISSLFLLLSTADNSGVNQDGINDTKDNDDYDTVMDDINESGSVFLIWKDYLDGGLTD